MSYAVGQKIRSIRNKLGLTLDEFGQLIDKNQPVKRIKSGTVSNWEQGLNKPNSRRLAIIAELGNTTVDELLKSEYLTCHNCNYDMIKDEYKYCPVCGKQQKMEVEINERN